MRQDKLPGSLRRGGRCLKRQGGGSGGGVGTILSNVLKKRSCISRTAPRLLCTLEPGEDPGLQMGRWKLARRPGSWCCCRLCLRGAPLGLCLGRGPPAGRRVRGTAAWRRRGRVNLGRQIAERGLGGGSGLPRRGGLGASPAARGPPLLRPVRGLVLLVPGAGQVLAPARATRGRATNWAPGLFERGGGKKPTGLIFRV